MTDPHGHNLPEPAAHHAAPGWYPDPSNPSGQRYWDGAAWRPAQPYPQPVAQPFAPAPIVAKNPALSAIVSVFIPGLGSIINGDVGIGIAIFCCYVVACFLILLLIGFVLAPAVWIWGIVDAYQGAVRWNAQRGIVS